MQTLSEKIHRLATIREELKALKQVEQALQSDVLAGVEQAGGSLTVEGITATLVQPKPRPVRDEAKLTGLVSPQVWTAVSTRHLDESKVAAAIARGTLDAETLEAVTTWKTTRPSVRLTAKAEEKVA